MSWRLGPVERTGRCGAQHRDGRVRDCTTALVATVAFVALLPGCGDDDPGATPTTTSAPTTEATTTTTAPPAPTTTTAAPACGPVELPPGADAVAESEGDVDGDGRADVLRSYGADDTWHLQVELSAGGGADVALVTFPGAAARVVGGADVDGDGADELWARTGAGASATILGLAVYSDCHLTQVTFESGEPAELPVGGSVGSASGVECDASADPEADLTAFNAVHIEDREYEVTATEYALVDGVLHARAERSSRADASDPSFTRATGFACGDLAV